MSKTSEFEKIVDLPWCAELPLQVAGGGVPWSASRRRVEVSWTAQERRSRPSVIAISSPAREEGFRRPSRCMPSTAAAGSVAARRPISRLDGPWSCRTLALAAYFLLQVAADSQQTRRSSGGAARC